MNIVIVESPAKAKTINKYLGSDYTVLASYGHIRDLPSKDGSVNPDDDFAMEYEVSAGSQKHIKAIADAVKKADAVFLATDPDREGEAISWHVQEALKTRRALKKTIPVKRIVFNEITKTAVTKALSNPRDIDMDLVNAQQARRALDYLVGFTLSPVLWRKLPGSKSAGRVQSVALRLICEREGEIEQFKPQEYWTIKGDFLTAKQDALTAQLSHLEGKKLDKFAFKDEQSALAAVEQLKTKTYHVSAIEKKQIQRKPQPPFTTSSLQQEASRKLGFGAKRTMQVAQKLYEGIDIAGETVGLITYMRTDGVQVSNEAIAAARNLIGSQFGQQYVPDSPRIYKTKAKNAQEAHEAIRPTSLEHTPEKIGGYLDQDQLKLYTLIWQRMMASQMANAVLDQVTIVIASDDQWAGLRVSGSTLRFDGFYKLYREGKDDAQDEDGQQLLPSVAEKEAMALQGVKPRQHFTEPPPRYSEASLVKKLEELGIGRPSTYAAIISVLQEREYVSLDKRRFMPEERGRLVTAFLTSFFTRYVEYDFTAQLEDELDNISAGEMEWKSFLRAFWDAFYPATEEVKKREMTDILEALDEALSYHVFPSQEDGKDPRVCPSCSDGRLSLRLGKFGAFIACNTYPECKYTAQLGEPSDQEQGEGDKIADVTILGQSPETGDDISLRKGPYGFYVQLGDVQEKEKKAPKPKRVSLPQGVDPSGVTLDYAIGLLTLPREIGTHPESGEMITAGIGRYGPYLLHQKKYTSLSAGDDVLTIGINRAVAVLGEKSKGKSAEPLRVIGEHPDDGAQVAIYDGRYGPYIKHQKTNAPLPKGQAMEDITLDAAVVLLKDRAAKKKKKKSA